MKTITYHGKEYIVEDWVNFVATDYCGDIWGYENEPGKEKYQDAWNNSNGGDYCLVNQSEIDWENSLEKV